MADAASSAPPQAEVSALHRRYVAILALFALLATLTAWLTVLDQRGAAAFAVDVERATAQQQRVQTVALLLAARSTAPDPAEQARLAERAAGVVAELEANASPELAGAIARFGRQASAALVAPPTTDNPEFAAVLAAANGPLSADLAAATARLAELAAASQHDVNSLQILARISLVVALVAAALLVFRPMVRALEAKLLKLTTSQEQLEAVLNTVAEAIITVGPDRRIVTANHAAQAVWGYSKAELIGMGMIMLLSPAQRKQQTHVQHYGYYGDLAARTAPRQVLEGIRKDGTVFPLELHVRETKLTSQTLLTIAARDITSRKQAEAALHASEALLRSFFESAPMMMGIVEIVDDAIVHISDNRRAAEFFDKPADALAQQSTATLGVEQAIVERWIWSYREAERLGTPVKFVYEHPCSTGSAWLSATVAASGAHSDGRTRYAYVVEDITRQKQADDRLKATTARLTTLLDSMQTGILMANEAGRVELINGPLLRMLGRGLAAIDVVGNSCAELADQHRSLFVEPDLFAASFRRTVAERTAIVGEEWQLVDGRTVERDYVPIVVDGVPRGHLWQYRDITARKQADAALRESRALLGGIVNTAMDGVITIDEHGTIQEFNPAAEAMFGRRRADVLGEDMGHLLLPPEYRAGHSRGLRNHLRTGESHVLGRRIEITAARADGTNFPIELTVTRMPIDGPPLFTGFVRDISIRKQAEAELRSSEQSIRQLYGITSAQQTSLVQKIQALLEMGCQRFGLETGVLSQVKDSTLEVIAVYPPEAGIARGAQLPIGDTFCVNTVAADQPHTIAHVGETAWRTLPCYAQLGIESYLGTKVIVDGELYGTLYFASRQPRPAPFKAAETEFLRLMAQWIGDETERERATFQLEAYAAEIDLANQALAAARDQALEVSRLKSEFLATMSHEIRTPMSAIIGMSELLLYTSLTSDQQEFAKVIATSAQALLQIINDILDFSKIEAGKMVLDQAELAVGEVVESVADLLAATARTKNLALMTSIAPDVPGTLIGDAGRLRQVLMNLAGNALKFTEQGEIVIWVTREQHPGPEVVLRIAVQDTGIGIDAAARARLFQPFVQGDGSTSRRYGGTGLGLAISQRLVTLMGGEIGVDSTVGQGSTFWFTLRLEQPALQAPPAPPEIGLELSGRRLLIVDDSDTSQTILARYAAQLGARCEATGDGAAALAMLAAASAAGAPFELALVDLRLPDMDGFQLAAAIHAQIAPPPALVLVTAFDQRGRAEEAHRAGFAAYLSKPVRQAQLRTALLQAQRGRHALAEPLAASASLAQQLDASAPCVLIVDDNPANRRVTTLQLAKAGYAARSATGGEEALAMLAAERDRFAAVLMDCNMPEMDGFETTRALRANEAPLGRHIPVIAMTANAMPGDRESCLEAGMDDYISKPLKVDRLRQLLERWVVALPNLGE